MPTTLSLDEKIAVLNLGDDENRYSLAQLDSLESALDQVEAAAPTALVTVATGKFYSNGLDLDYMRALVPDEARTYVRRVQALLARLLVLPVPTVAAINGHAFGAGAMFAMAHDFRMMNSERGYFCFPEVDINMSFSPGMVALMQSKLTPAASTESMTTGRRYGGVDAAECGLVDRAVAPDELLPTASAYAATLSGKASAPLGAIKRGLFGPAYEALLL